MLVSGVLSEGSRIDFAAVAVRHCWLLSVCEAYSPSPVSKIGDPGLVRWSGYCRSLSSSYVAHFIWAARLSSSAG